MEDPDISILCSGTQIHCKAREPVPRPREAKKNKYGTSLLVQWLIFHISTTEGTCSISVQGTKILHAAWSSQK